jgi:hypothetical protein
LPTRVPGLKNPVRPSHARRIVFILSLTAITLMPFPLTAQPKGLGMWVWSKSSFSTEEARRKLMQFCLEHRIGHLDVHVRISHEDEKPRLKDPEALKQLILLAGRHQITTAALRGNPKMFFAANHGRTAGDLEAIIDFSRTLPDDSLFKGIKYDVEPYCTPEWRAKGAARESAMRDYLDFLRKARSILTGGAPRLWLAVDTPFWWDKDQFIIEFGGERKRFNEQIQDLTHFIVVMSYRRSVEKVLSCVEGERSYARRVGKVIFPSLETVRVKQDPHVSFWGMPDKDLWEAVPRLLGEAKQDPALGGLMIHCYRSLLERWDKTATTPEQNDLE